MPITFRIDTRVIALEDPNPVFRSFVEAFFVFFDELYHS